MSVNPILLNGMLYRTNDYGAIKHNEDHKPVTEQQVISSMQVKQEEQHLHTVTVVDQKDNKGYRYDAKEKGNQSYQRKNKKKKQSEKTSSKEHKEGHFDIKI